MKNELLFTIGLPRSGKSTRCRELVSLYRNLDKTLTIYNEDSLRLSMGCRYNSWTEDMVETMSKYIIKTLLIDNNVIIDETHTTEKSIKSVYLIEPNATPIFVSTDLDTCIHRAIENKQSDLVVPIRRMYQNIESLKIKYGNIDKAIENIRKEAIKEIEEHKQFQRIVR